MLPTEDRKSYPMARGCLDYFPRALAEVARVSLQGQEQHGHAELEWVRGVSGDHADAIIRHLADRGTIDTDGVPHSAKVAWRALAILQEELEFADAEDFRRDREPNAAYPRGVDYAPDRRA